MYNVSDPYVADSVDVRFFGLLTDQLHVGNASIDIMPHHIPPGQMTGIIQSFDRRGA